MKNRILFALIGLMLPLLAAAQRITDDEAKGIASQVLGKQVVKAEVEKPAKAPVKDGVQQTEPFYSIFTGEDGAGFVIVSTDRRAPQIIGYGDGKADANNLPPQLKAILEKQDSVLQATPNLPEHSSWRKKAPTRVGEEGGKLLKTANWGQGYPYNLMTPEIDGEHCPTGCVATAMAIIMKYHGWPEKGRGEYSYEHWDGQQLSCDFENTTFGWKLMSDDYDYEGTTEEQALAVSELMNACGVAINTSYSPGASGSSTDFVLHSLYKYFYYGNKRSELRSTKYNNTELTSIVKNEIDNNRPVLLNGTVIFGTHAFVGDGYNEDGFVHINYGWDGSMNGYYSFLDCQTPLIQMEALSVGIEPDKDLEEYKEETILTYDRAYNGIYLDRENINTGVPFNVFEGTIVNTDSCEVAIAHVDKDGKIKEVLRTHVRPDVPSAHNLDFKSLVTSQEIETGDKIQLMYRLLDEETWKNVTEHYYKPSSAPCQGNVVKASEFEFDVCPKTLEPVLSYSEDSTDGTSALPILGSDLFISVKGLDKSKTTYCSIHEEGSVYTDYYEFRPGEEVSLHLSNLSSAHCQFKIKQFDENEFIDNVSVDVESPGSLQEKMKVYDTDRVRSLAISGKMDLEDYNYLKDFLVLKHLDLSNVDQQNLYSGATGSIKNGRLRFLKLPSNLEVIGCSAVFCENLLTLVIPEKVFFIDWVGIQFYNLQNIIVQSKTPPTLDHKGIMEGHYPSLQYVSLFVPKGTKDAYSNSEEWKMFGRIVETDWDSEKFANHLLTVNGVEYMLSGEDAYALTLVDKSIKDVRIEELINYKGKAYTTTKISRNAYLDYYSGMPRTVFIPKGVELFQYEFIAYVENYFLDEANSVYESKDGVLYNKEKKALVSYPACSKNPVFEIEEGTLSILEHSIYLDPIINGKSTIVLPESIKQVEHDFWGTSWTTSNPAKIVMKTSEPPLVSGGNFYFCTPSDYDGIFIPGWGYYDRTVLYVPSGSKEKYLSDSHWNKFRNIIEYEGEWHEIVSGDANGDGKYTISDVTFTVNHIMGTLTEGNDFYAEVADMDKDGNVLVNDLTAIIDLVLAANNAASIPAHAPLKKSEASLSVFEMSETSGSVIDVAVKPGYIATQFDVILPEGASLTKTTLVGNNAKTHKMTYRRLADGRVRVVIFSMDNAEMTDNLVRLTLQGDGEVVLTNALVNEIQADGKIVEKATAGTSATVSDNATDIEGLTIDQLTIDDCMYNLNGQKVSSDYKGIVIKNGNKVHNK